MNTTLFDEGSHKVWGRISLMERTDLVVLNNGNLNVDRYILDFPKEHVPLAPYIGPHFRMQDNTRPLLLG